ncbi:MAG TPA: methionine--tRNA ligase [Candidatus Faecicola pullistercoris]|nr:methionine--tRNA ligase [Candidatus Faecicola pullistercoris]
MSRKEKFYITTAIAYTSGKPHIGNTYEIVLTDALARFKRRQGYDVFFQTGTDEHGQKIEEKAAAAGKTPKQFVDEVADTVKNIWDLMNTSYDKFIRTTDEYHVEQVQKIFRKLYEQGDIYKGSYKGLYCTPCESFWTESQLVDGKCPDCGREVKPAEEEAYFFKMSKYADRLMQYMQDNPDFILPVSRKNEMINNFLKPGLQDLCVSRSSFKWGIPVDFDSRHVVYVWLDALTNYITGIGYDCDGNSDEKFRKYWPADVHVIGKDIVRFHTLYWPIFLMALGLPLPKQVFGHPWLLQDGGKMSKSKGNIMYADDMVKLFGVDPVRYYLLSEMPFDNDGSIGWDTVAEKINADLANVLGNLVSRTVAMSNKYFGGTVENKNAEGEPDAQLKAVVSGAYAKVAGNMDRFKVADALDELFVIFRRANKYIDETTPWVLAKNPENADRLKTVLYNLTESIAVGASLLEPFMPELAVKILGQLGETVRPYDSLSAFGTRPNGVKVTASPEICVARLDIAEVMKKVEDMFAPPEIKVQEKEQIDIDEFFKSQLVVGKIIACEKVEKADKLLKSTVKIGNLQKTIVSGIAKWYTPEQMVGKNVVVVLNLKPAKLRGIVSEGMLLCAEDDKGNVVLISPEKELASGSEVR